MWTPKNGSWRPGQLEFGPWGSPHFPSTGRAGLRAVEGDHAQRLKGVEVPAAMTLELFLPENNSGTVLLKSISISNTCRFTVL